MEVPFIHLHCHSHYSLLDGAAKIKDLVKRAKDLGMPALAITDHGNLYGALEFYRTAKDEGIKPIIGYEAYIATGSRTDKSAGNQKDSDEDEATVAVNDPGSIFFGASSEPARFAPNETTAATKSTGSKKNTSHHLTLLALNHTGYKNLLKLSSTAYLEGFYSKPRIDKEVLQQYNEGLICLSGCVSGEIAKLIGEGTADGFARAKEVAAWYRELFGDRYYIELQDNGLVKQKMILEGTLKLAEELNIPTVATSDVHYIYQKDHDAQDMLLCVNTGKLRTDPKRMRMNTDPLKPGQLIDQFYFRSGKDMQRAMPGLEDAIARTIEIADRVNIELDLTQKFPAFTPPNGLSPDDYLRELCLDGLKKRYVNNPKRFSNGQLSEEVLARLDRELSVIAKKDFPGYFLVVWDIVRFAEERGIHRTARGSGVGALVCYALNMSHVCPLEYGLLFERFLDEQRNEAPDIDIDFDGERRNEIFDYVVEKYGKENVAQLGTFGTLAAKNAIKAVGRTLDMPISFVGNVTKLVPDSPKMTIEKALTESAELNNLYETDAQVKELINYAKPLEGLAGNVAVHACGVIIADKPLIEYVPLRLADKKGKKKGKEKEKGKEGIVTQWQGKDVEEAGLLKMDLLGVITLTVVAHTVDLVKERTGITIDPLLLPLDDKKTYELLCRGETKGTFQLKGGGMRELLQRMKPDNFRDIIAIVAMYRPGPMDNIPDYVNVKHGKTKPKYEHPILEEILAETNGIMVYQEQIMQILNRLGNIPLGNAYACIKAISKKKDKDIGKYRERFVAGAKKNGLAPAKAETIFGLIFKFAGYGFNKSHATAYASEAYTTAYLKAHYPVEYMAALLCGNISKKRNFTSKDSTVEHIEDCQRMGIEIVPPDVNTSKQLYSVVDGKIAFALTAIKSCGGWAADKIVEAREKGGKFKDLFDFCSRVDNKACNRGAIEALIKAGAFDSMGYKRSHLFQMVESALKVGHGAAEDAAKGQGNLFGGNDEPVPQETPVVKGLPPIPEWSNKEKSNYEKEVLGFYLTSHPLQEYADVFAMLRSHPCSEATVLPDKTQVVLAGVVSDIRIGTGKSFKPGKPNRYAMFTLEDASGSIRTIMWSEAYEQFSHLIQSDSVVIMQGRVDRSRCADAQSPDGNFIVDEAFTVEEAPKKLCRGWVITLDEERHTTDAVEMLLKILRENPGSGSVELSLRLKEGAIASFRGGKTTAGVTPALYRRITELLGADSAKALIKKPQSGYKRG